MIITIQFEIDDNAPLFEGCETLESSIHEALCLTTHEGDDEGLNWLSENILDIS